MGVLDTFYILFKTSADEAKKEVEGLEDAATNAAEAVDKIGKSDAGVSKVAAGLGKAEGNAKKLGSAANQATDQTQQLGTALDRAEKNSGRLGTSFVTAVRNIAAPLIAAVSVGAIANFATEQAAKIRELDQQAAKLNTSIGNVDAFRRVVRNAGGDMAQASDSLAKIGEKINEAFSDKESGARKDFKEWGLTFQDTKKQALGAVEAMVALAGNLEKVSQAEALARIKKLGIEDPATIELLLSGKKAVEERLEAEKKLGVVTERQAQIAREYQREMGRTQSILQSLGDTLMEAVLPAVTAGLRAFGQFFNWLTNNQALVTGFFIAIAAVITTAYLPAILAAAAATITALAPFLAIGAAIAAVGAAFALAYEDVVAFMNGQPSLIGSLAEEYEWFATIVKGVGDTFNYLKQIAATSFEGTRMAWDALVSAFSAAWPVFRQTWENIVSGVIWVKDQWLSVWGPMFSAVYDLWSAFGEFALAVIQKLAGDLANFGTSIGGAFDGAKTAVSGAIEFMLGLLGPFRGDIEAVVGSIPEIFRVMAGIVKSIWQELISWIAGGIQGLADRIRSVTSWLSGRGPVPPPAGNDNLPGAASDIGALVNAGRNQMVAAAGNPMGAQTSGSIRGAAGAGNTENNNTVNANVTVNTQASDPKAVASEVRNQLSSQFRQSLSNFDDGVDR